MAAAAGHCAGMPLYHYTAREAVWFYRKNEEILDELERLLRAYLHRYVRKEDENITDSGCDEII